MNGKARFVMLVGLPASGKSTWTKWVCEGWGAVCVSSDAIRAELYGDEAIQGKPAEVFKIAKDRIVHWLNKGKDVILDATNMSSKRRIAMLRELKQRAKQSFYAECQVFATPIEICVERDAERDRTVGRSVIEEMAKHFEVPYYHEGWDYIGLHCSEDWVSNDELIDEMIGFDQQNPHHTLDLFQHTLAAFRSVGDNQVYRGEAALWHDIGKLFTQTFDEKGVAHYYSHENVGAYTFLCLRDTRLFNTEDALLVATLINYHMQPYFCGDDEDRFTEWGRKRGMTDELIEDIWQLHIADKEAH